MEEIIKEVRDKLDEKLAQMEEVAQVGDLAQSACEELHQQYPLIQYKIGFKPGDESLNIRIFDPQVTDTLPIKLVRNIYAQNLEDSC